MSRSRWAIIVVLIVSLLCSTLLRRQVVGQRESFEKARGFEITRSGHISQVPSYALGLLLGGLRGPLAIMLWTSSENQKIDRNMEDFHTKVELIRLLQGEFPTVFLYESWNMAFNWSVQAANASSKYAILLDAIQFDNRAEAESPENINVVMQTSQLYFDKFGNSAEKSYYSPRLRDESRAGEDHVRMRFSAALKDKFAIAARMAGADYLNLLPIERTENDEKVYYLSLRKSIFDHLPKDLVAQAKCDVIPFKAETARGPTDNVRHPQLLDANGNLLPSFYKPLGDRELTFTGADGSAMPYLKQFEPYPYGVSPFALSYNYVKRAQWLLVNRGVHHVQLSDRVISSRPALSLMKWAEEEMRRARRCELDSLGIAIPPDEDALDEPSSSIALNHPLNNGPLLAEALFSYDRSIAVSQVALTEFDLHSKIIPDDANQYRSHMQTLRAQVPYYTADAAFLRAMTSTGADRDRQIAIARENYAKAADEWARVLITYYGGDPTVGKAMPRGLNPTALDTWTHDQLVNTAMMAGQLMSQTQGTGAYNDDVAEYATYVKRCVQRNLALQ